MAVEKFGGPRCFHKLNDQIAKVHGLHQLEETTVETSAAEVEELHRCWQEFSEAMAGRLHLEGLIERASLSYDEETDGYDEGFRQQAVNAINEEIDRLRKQINTFLQVGKHSI